jgi:recombination protein RecT
MTQETKQTSNSIITEAMAKSTKKGTLAGLKHTDIQTVINGMKAQIAQALPKHLSADRMVQMAVSLIAKNPKIAECSAQSLIGAVMQASILGFKPVEALGECYFVPYGGQVQFQIGYKGFIKLAQQSGQLKNIYAEVVREGDEFIYELGLEPRLIHIPNPESEGKIKFVYAVAHLQNGGYNFQVLTFNQIEKLRLRNPMTRNNPKPSGAWATDYEAMAKAKAIKQLVKYLPLSDTIFEATKADEAIIKENAFTNNNSGLDVDAFDYSEEVVEVKKETKKAEKETPNKELKPNADLANELFS